MSANQPEAPWPALRRASRTVVVVDMVESVRLMEQDEDDTVRRWQAFVREVTQRLLPEGAGRLVKSLGDGLMLEFESVPPAIQCALAMHHAAEHCNVGLPADRWMCLRMGAHVSDVIVDELDIYGSGVNLAARLATLARPGEAVVSVEVRDRLVPGLDADVDDLGLCHLKHVSKPVRAFRLTPVSSQMPPPRPVRTLPQRDLLPSLAVVLSPVLAPAPAAAVTAELLVDEITAAMSRSSSVNVVSRLSAVAFSERPHLLSEAERYLGVDFILGGRCVAVGDQLRFHFELVDSGSGQVLWAEGHTVRAEDLLSGHSEAVQSITQGVHGAVVSHALQRTSTQPWPNLRAYEFLSAAITLMHRGALADFDRAHALLLALIERNPRQASAHAWLAKWHVLRVNQGWTEDRQADGMKALEYSRRAVDFDPECSLAYTVDGSVHVSLLKRLDIAEKSYEHALRVDPNDSLAWVLKGTLHAFRGEGETALGAARHALKLTPLHPTRYYYESLAATAALSAGRFDEAVELARASLRLNRMHTSTLRALIIAQVQLGQLDAAREGMRALRALEPDLTVERYLERSPSSAYATGKLWAAALATAGLPAR